MEKRELTYRVYGVLEQSGISQVGTMELDGEDKVIFLKTELSDYEARGKKFRTKLDIISKSDLNKYLSGLLEKSLMLENKERIVDEETYESVNMYFNSLDLATSVFSTGETRKAWEQNAQNFFNEVITQRASLGWA